MRARTLAAAAAAAALVGCPIPQPLPDYPAGTITPPRIVSGTPTLDAQSILPVPAGCTGAAPQIDLGAQIFYQDSNTVAARWFVDYSAAVASRYAIQNANQEVPADPNPLVLERTVPPFSFRPYGYPPPPEISAGADPTAPGVVHVVELVVSNGFDADPQAPEPNRTPAVVPGGGRFEIQTYRWVFVNVAPPTGCTAGAPGCCP